MLVVVDPKLGAEAHRLAAHVEAVFGRACTAVVAPMEPPDPGLAAGFAASTKVVVTSDAPPSWLRDLDAPHVRHHGDDATLIERVADAGRLEARPLAGRTPKLEPLDAATLAGSLGELAPHWRLEVAAAPRLPHGLKVELVADVRCPDHLTGADLARAIADIAETQDHHPTLSQAYRTLTIRVTTGEAAGRLTRRDIAFAEAVDALVSARVPAGG
mgnify:FL=1